MSPFSTTKGTGTSVVDRKRKERNHEATSMSQEMLNQWLSGGADPCSGR